MMRITDKLCVINIFFLGYKYCHGHMTRSCCCRVPDDIVAPLSQIRGFTVNHAYLGRVTRYNMAIQSEMPSQLSVNWSKGDEKIEIISGRTGKSIER